MNRRRFIGLLAGAAAALGLAKAVPAAPANPDMAHSTKGYNINARGARLNMHVYGDGSGQQWILDPTHPHDLVYSFSPREFIQDDAKTYRAFARMEFSRPQPQQSRVIGLTARTPDAL